MFFFNLGMIAVAENEAFIAAVLAHEAGHYLFKHSEKTTEKYGVVTQIHSMYLDDYKGFMRMSRQMEQQADSFAIACLKNANINLEPLLQYHEGNDAQEQASFYSRSYKNMLKASSLNSEGVKHRRSKVYNPYSSHPAAIERFAYVKKAMDNCNNCGEKFFVDSLFFGRLKKQAKEERKKMALEETKLNSCTSFSFIDYLYEPKSIKNLYYLIESTRRTLYVNPKLADKGFLTDAINDDVLYYNNQSVLHKPEFLFNTYKEFVDLKDHPFITSEKKPFETYQQAFLFFTDQALKLNLNEANFSLALYYYSLSKTDSVKKYLETYISKGHGLYIDYASSLLKGEKNFPINGRTFMVYNNVSNYNKSSFNYYLAQKRKIYNSAIREKFGKDSTKIDLVILNELLGNKPQKLHEIQNLIYTVFSLYNDDDIEIFKKIRLTSHFAGEDGAATMGRRKELTIYAPEWYNWFKEKHYSKFFLVDVVYQCKKPLELEESFNNYTGYYFDLNMDRPYFRDASRSGFKLKQKESEIHSELYAFLYE